MDSYNDVSKLVCKSRLFQEAFWASVRDKVITTGYVQIDNYYRHYSGTERKKLLSKSKLQLLILPLQKSYPYEDEFIAALKDIEKIALPSDLLDGMDSEVAKAIVSWLFYCNKQKYSGVLRDELSKWVSTNKDNITYIEKKYILRGDVDFRIIRGLSQYVDTILGLTPQSHIFFRGQESLNYLLQPSIMRTPQLFENEEKLYQELILRCPNDFTNCKSHLDFLVQMQHYGLPTRLIDITSNPLVALYFASLGKSEKGSGEVIVFDASDNILKYERSDTVSILSCLPLFDLYDQKQLFKLSCSGDEKSFNGNETVLRLLHEIKIDKPAFSNRIKPEDIRKNLVVTPSMKNNRIIKQSGAFIICGLTDYPNHKDDTLELLRYSSPKSHQLLLIIENKEKIIKELNAFNLNSSTLFPEIDDVATYLKEHWI